MEKHPVKLTDQIEKTYQFPTLYSDVTTATGIFVCSYAAAREIISDPRIRPVRPGGDAFAVVTSYRYNQVLGIPAYNEIAVAILVEVGPEATPILDVLEQEAKFGIHIITMPVTTTENRRRGEVIWGLPKIENEIDLVVDKKNKDYVTIAKEKVVNDYVPYLEFRVPLEGRTVYAPEKTRTVFTLREGELMQATTVTAAGSYVVPQLALVRKPPYLTVGDTPQGKFLQKLKLNPHPLQLRFARGVSSAFNYPQIIK